MTVYCSPLGPRPQFLLATGIPAVGYQLFWYVGGSVNTKQNTYTDSTGGTSNANPLVLNTLGEPTTEIWLTAGQTYKAVLAPDTDTDPPTSPVWTIDGLRGINDTSVSMTEWIAGPVPTFIGATQFTLVGDQTATFNIGRRVMASVTAGTSYGTITNSVFGAVTTVTVDTSGSNPIDAGLSAVSYGMLSAGAPKQSISLSAVAGFVSTSSYCVEDGVVDDTAAFNIARAAALGRTLHIFGTPLIKSAMTISSREHWVFAGAVGNSNGGLPGSYLVKGSALNGDLVTITADGTLIENGGILGQGSAQGAGGTGYTVKANGVHLSRPYVAWMKSHGIRVGSDVDGGNSNSFDFYHPVCLQNGGHGIFADDANVGATVSAGAFVTGTYYFIKVVGTTDFTLIGAKSNTVGELFIATGVGAGNGTAYEAQPNANGGVINAPFTQSNAGDGIRFDRAWANTVVGGVSEQNTGYGIDFEKGSYGNEIFNLDYYENNTAGDVNWVNGAHNNIVWGRSGATPPTKTTLRGNGNAMYGERPVGLAHCGTLTRDRTAAGANVSYTGVGFCPSRIEFRAVVENSANPNSYGWTDGLNNYCNYMIAGSTSLFASAVRCIWSEDTPNAATAEIGSFDRDGFTLVWYKVNAPAAGNITVQYIAHR